MHVVLIHGMGRTPRSMGRLGRRLTEHGHEVSYFGYGVRSSTLDALAARFSRELSAVARRGPYAVIGHSLGNVIYRLAEPSLDRLPAQVVMLAPPNTPSAAARLLSELPVARVLFRAITGHAGERLVDADFYAALPVPRAPALVLAGDRGPRGALPFERAPNDGLVAVEETRLPAHPGAPRSEHEVVPAIHTFIMNHPRVLRRIEDALSGHR